MFLDGPPPADLFVAGKQCSTELLEAVKLADFSWGLAPSSRAGKGFRDGFAADFAGQAEVRTWGWLARLMTTTGRFATAALDGADRIGPKVAELPNLAEQFAAFVLQSGYRSRHENLPS